MNIDNIYARHGFMEAVEGYIECTCGWPSREQYDAGEHEVEHIVVELVASGFLTRTQPLT